MPEFDLDAALSLPQLSAPRHCRSCGELLRITGWSFGVEPYGQPLEGRVTAHCPFCEPNGDHFQLYYSFADSSIPDRVPVRPLICPECGHGDVFMRLFMGRDEAAGCVPMDEAKARWSCYRQGCGAMFEDVFRLDRLVDESDRI